MNNEDTFRGQRNISARFSILCSWNFLIYKNNNLKKDLKKKKPNANFYF